MALNLTSESPLLSGMEQGSNIFQKLIQPYMESQKMAQQYQMHMDELPYKQALQSAQMKDALARAQKNEFMTKLLTGEDVSSGQQTGSGTPSVGLPSYQENQQQQIQAPSKEQVQGLGQKQQPSQRDAEEIVIKPAMPGQEGKDRLVGMPGFGEVKTHTDDAGNLVSRYPSGKITVIKTGPSKTETARTSEFAKSDAKIREEKLKDMNESGGLLNTYGNLRNILEGDEWKNLQQTLASKFGGDFGRSFSLKKAGNYGTPEQQDAVGRVKDLLGEIVSKSAALFKGPFRVAEQGLIESMKPKENEPLAVQLGKLEEMEKTMTLQHEVNTEMPRLIRQGMSAEDAFQQIMNETGANKQIEQYRDKYLKGGSAKKSKDSSRGQSSLTAKVLKYNPATGRVE